MALGAFLSHGGLVSGGAVFLITWVTNVATATAVYGAGHVLGRSFFAGRLGRRLLDPRRLEQLDRMYDRYGAWGIFLSRFIPGVRAVVPPFAGVARLHPARAIPPMVLASGIWYGLLTYLAVTVARSMDELVALVGRLNWMLAVVAGVVLLAVVGVGLAHRARRASIESTERADTPAKMPPGP
ncbi:MAG: hypothetical protein A2W29_07450 [Gemmatimonadetes bacterium RBG_16_66_8]|nr:MAG: hypothetical protein A2W29_07450 [Gemmatimonadetes bacterium RBG_16_66_8]